MKSQPRAFSAWANATVCSRSQPCSTQSVADTRTPTGIRRDRRAHRLEHLEREAHAVLQRAAILVVALVGERREELVQQVAMRRVQLDRLRARAAPPASPRRRRRPAPAPAQPRPAPRGVSSGFTGRRRRLAVASRRPRPGSAARLPTARGWRPCARHGRAARRPAWRSTSGSPPAPGPAPRSFASEYRPRSPGVMRPSGSTAVASRISSPAPDRASWPRWIMCQSVALPSSAEYWHIGAITMRFGRVSPASSIGWKSGWSYGSPSPRLQGGVAMARSRVYVPAA